MKAINRRDLLASLGVLGGSALVTGCSNQLPSGAVASASEPNPTSGAPIMPARKWAYVTLDPAVVADTAYHICPEGGCMYGVVGSVISVLADKVGEPFRSFPIEMMRYGDGGVARWGSLCGVVNGGAALIGLFQNEKDAEQRERLITELCVWYETTSLPKYEPAQFNLAGETEPSVAGSVLCHVSVARWCKASGCEAFSEEKKERCRRLASDGAMKVVEILNRNVASKLTPKVKSCVDCHGKKDRADAAVNMNCTICHQFDKKHP